MASGGPVRRHGFQLEPKDLPTVVKQPAGIALAMACAHSNTNRIATGKAN